MTSHCPYRQSILLQQALSPDKMRVAFLLGAGCPVSIRVQKEGKDSALIPDIAGLTNLVNQYLAESDQNDKYQNVLSRLDEASKLNIEKILSHLRALQDVVREGEIDGLNKTDLIKLDTEICDITTKIVGVDLPTTPTPYHHLSSWISGIKRTHPVEIFTPNYDLLLEQSLESRKVPYFDGFIGSKQAFFDLTTMENESLPSRWVRLWKLHGSVNWWRTASDEVVRVNDKIDGARQMIYPSHLKYDQSRRMPYLAMLDRLKDFLSKGQALLITCGYSFADQHLNEVILHGLRSNPTATCFGLMYSELDKHEEAVSCATKTPNLSILAYDGAVIGTLKSEWATEHQLNHPMNSISLDLIKEMDGEDELTEFKFKLGDFNQLGKFLAYQLSNNLPEDHNAK